MRTHRWIRLSFLNFPSLIYSQYVTYVALFKSTISRAYFAESEKSVPPSIFLRFTTENTHTCAPFLNCYTGPFLCGFYAPPPFDPLCPLFFGHSFRVSFFHFFQISGQKQLTKREKRHTKTPLWDYFILILFSLLFCV